jgi:hypothetical protein
LPYTGGSYLLYYLFGAMLIVSSFALKLRRSK